MLRTVDLEVAQCPIAHHGETQSNVVPNTKLVIEPPNARLLFPYRRIVARHHSETSELGGTICNSVP
jgi:hypothetical protein